MPRQFPLIGVAVPIGLRLRGPNIHSLSAGDRGEAPIHTEEIAGRATGVADFGDAEGVI